MELCDHPSMQVSTKGRPPYFGSRGARIFTIIQFKFYRVADGARAGRFGRREYRRAWGSPGPAGHALVAAPGSRCLREVDNFLFEDLCCVNKKIFLCDFCEINVRLCQLKDKIR